MHKSRDELSFLFGVTFIEAGPLSAPQSLLTCSYPSIKVKSTDLMSFSLLVARFYENRVPVLIGVISVLIIFEDLRTVATSRRWMVQLC